MQQLTVKLWMSASGPPPGGRTRDRATLPQRARSRSSESRCDTQSNGARADGGVVFMSTFNKTLRSFALGIVAAAYVLQWLPKDNISV